MCITTPSTATGTTSIPPPSPTTNANGKKSALKQRCMSDTDLFAMVGTVDLGYDDDYSLSSNESNDDDEQSDIGSLPLPSPVALGSSETESSSSSSSTSGRGHKKTVSFGNCAELSFPVVAGDARIEMAYPMTLGWDCVSESSFSVDDYEEIRCLTRGNGKECRTGSADERRKILKHSKKAHKQHQKHTAQQANGRPGMVRRNSMASGCIGIDGRRNRVQDFLGRFQKNMMTSSNRSLTSRSSNSSKK